MTRDIVFGLSRRRFLRHLGAFAASPAIFLRPSDSNARPPASPWRIGMLSEGQPWGGVPELYKRAFVNALKVKGYSEDTDFTIVRRDSYANFARLPSLAEELLNEQVDIIIAEGGSAAKAAKRATSKIPI